MNDSNQKATKIEYTLNNGSTWNTASTTEATSGSFTISGLTEGTNYSVKVRTTRKANSITYVTSVLPIKTWYYPYATTSPNFTVGNSLTIALTNEKPKSVKVYLKIGNNTSTLYETTSTTSVTGFNSAAWKTWLYSQLPTKNPTAYQVVVVETASSTTRTRNAGNTVIINETECKPVYDTSNGFDYTDINTNVTSLTGNNQIIVKGYSDIAATVSTAQKATAPSGTSSSIVDYTLKIGNQTARNDYSSDSAVRIPATGSIQGVNPDIVSGQGTISVIATDSRGLTTTSSKTATVKEYTQPVISNITATRSLNGAGEEVTLSLNGTYWKDSFGTSNNTIVSVIYKFRKSTTQTWTTGTTTITPTLSGDNNTFKVENLPIRGDTSEGEWTANDTYIIRIEVKDTLLNAVSSNVAREYTIVAGTPAIAIYKSNVAIGNKFDTSKNNDKLQVSGRVDIMGSAADAPLVVRGIAGSDGSGNIDDLYLQYGQNKKVVLGNTGGYNISADGSKYSGTATNADTAKLLSTNQSGQGTGAVLSGRGGNYIFAGPNDAANDVGGNLNNLVFSSWNGVSFTTSCTGQTYTNKNAVSMNCRNGRLNARYFYENGYRVATQRSKAQIIYKRQQYTISTGWGDCVLTKDSTNVIGSDLVIDGNYIKVNNANVKKLLLIGSISGIGCSTATDVYARFKVGGNNRDILYSSYGSGWVSGNCASYIVDVSNGTKICLAVGCGASGAKVEPLTNTLTAIDITNN